MNDILSALAERLNQLNYTVTTAESCTGGGISFYLTGIAGSSSWFERSYVTYSNEAKVNELEVLPSTIEEYGVVSEPVVAQMAVGAALRSGANCAIAVSGIAGPDGGSEQKPVGTVCIAWSVDGVVETITELFDGDRQQVREKTIASALKGLLRRL